MRGSRVVPGLVPILMIGAIACDSQDPMEAAAVDRVTVRIEGPDVIDGGGTWSWLAITNDGGDYEYVWDVEWLDSDEPSLRVHGQVLELEVERRRDIELRVRVMQDGRTVASASHGRACDDTLLVEDYRIDGCYEAE